MEEGLVGWVDKGLEWAEEGSGVTEEGPRGGWRRGERDRPGYGLGRLDG